MVEDFLLSSFCFSLPLFLHHSAFRNINCRRISPRAHLNHRPQHITQKPRRLNVNIAVNVGPKEGWGSHSFFIALCKLEYISDWVQQQDIWSGRSQASIWLDVAHHVPREVSEAIRLSLWGNGAGLQRQWGLERIKRPLFLEHNFFWGSCFPFLSQSSDCLSEFFLRLSLFLGLSWQGGFPRKVFLQMGQLHNLTPYSRVADPALCFPPEDAIELGSLA